MRHQIQWRVPLQGNFDPLALLAGGAALDRGVDNILAAFSERRFIINLGHGGVAGVVRIAGGVVSGVINLESSSVGATDWRPRHEELYQEVCFLAACS